MHDVVVCGAGPAGAQLAFELANDGHDVCLVEKSRHPGAIRHDSGLVPVEMFERFDIPQKLAGARIARLRFILPGHDPYGIDYGRTIGYILDRKAFAEYIIKRARAAGATLLTQQVTAALREGGRVVGVTTDEQEIRAPLTIDATGAAGVLTKSLGLDWNRKQVRYCVCAERDLEKKHHDVHCADFRFDMPAFVDAPRVQTGYSWVYPTGARGMVAGWGYVSTVPAAINPAVPLKAFMDKTYPDHERCLVQESRSMDPLGPVLKKNHLPGFLSIGSAAREAGHNMGEGIRWALGSGRLAASILSEALKKGEYDRTLSEYRKRWEALDASRMRLLWAGWLGMERMTPQEMLDTYSRLMRLPPEGILNVILMYDMARWARDIIRIGSKPKLLLGLLLSLFQ